MPDRGVAAFDTVSTALALEASLGETDAPRYFVRLPPVRVDGREQVLPPIELELRRLDGGIEPFNC